MRTAITVKAVVFDLDGTITSFNIDRTAVRAEIRSFLISSGIPASVLSVNESTFEMLKKTEIFMKNHGKSKETAEKVVEKALATAEKYELEAAKSTSLLSGVVETLKTLKEMSLKIGLFTINNEKSVDYILKRFQIAKYFDAVIPRNKVKHIKPSNEHLETVLETLAVNANEVIVVGDGTVDMQCARELKAIGVGLPTGISSKTELINSGANYVITAITDLPALVKFVGKT